MKKLNPIKKRNLPVDRNKWLAGVYKCGKDAIDKHEKKQLGEFGLCRHDWCDPCDNQEP